MEITNTLTKYREEIRRCQNKFLTDRGHELTKVNGWGDDVCRRLRNFSENGKMIRGGLVLWIYSAFKGEPPDHIVPAAAAMELFQASFLIHDDIMDRDYMRRGSPTVFAQYRQLGERQNIPAADRFGEAMGICAGDISFYFAFQILTRLDLAEKLRERVLDLCFKEISSTCVAQMQDVGMGFSPEQVSENEVFQLYKYKTGRYTFSLPFMLGAMLAEQDENILSILETLGEEFGIIFQIKDDEMGFFGDEKDIGKPVGSDVRENKKTLLRVFMEEAATEEQLEVINKIYGKEDLGEDELNWLRSFAESSGALQRENATVNEHAERCRELINSISGISEACRKEFLELLEYNIRRSG